MNPRRRPAVVLALVAVLAFGCGSEQPLTIEGVGPSNGPPFNLRGGDYLVTASFRSCSQFSSISLWTTRPLTYVDSISSRYFYDLPRGEFFIDARLGRDCEWRVNFEPVR